MSMERKKYAGLDIAKFLCALIVLFYHFFSEHGPIPSLFEDILSFYAVCVALFMVISGFLLYDKLIVTQDKAGRWSIVKKQVLRILQIYALWSIPYLLYTVLRWDPSSISVSFLLWKIQSWIFSTTFYTIWFMPSLAIGILISYFAYEHLPGWAMYVIGLCAYVIGSLNVTYSFLVSGYSWYEGVHQFIGVWLNGARGWLFFGFPLVTLGWIVAENKKRLSLLSSGVLSVLFMGGILAEALILRKAVGHTGIDMTVFMIPATYCMTVFLLKLPVPWFTGCVWFRKMSVLIFMSQRVFLTVLPSLCGACLLFDNMWASFVIMCGGTVVCSALVILASKKIAFLKRLY